MLVKYSMGLSLPFFLHLACWLLLIPQFCATITCPPPDFPERGRYEPVKADYEVGETVAYHCDERLPMIDAGHNWLRKLQVATCEPNGRWSRGMPFCDVPAKLINPTTSSKALESAVLDGDSQTCAPTRNEKEEFLRFSLEREAVVYATIMCWWNGNKTIKIFGSVWQSVYKADSHMCFVDTYKNTDVKTENITVQISSESASSIHLCVIEVFTKDDKWCAHPPLISVANGQLEVGRSKAILHCNEGFKEKDGQELYATCENNKWSYKGLQCGDGKPDHKALAIVFGCMVVIMIFIFVGWKIFVIRRKRTRGVAVRYIPGENNYSCSPFRDSGHNILDSSEPEYFDINQSNTTSK